MRIVDHRAKITAFERAMGKLESPEDWRLYVWMIEKAATQRMNAAFHAWGLTPVYPAGAVDLPLMPKPAGEAFQDAGRYQVMAERGDLIHVRFLGKDLALSEESECALATMEFIERERVEIVRGEEPQTETTRQKWRGAYHELVRITDLAMGNLDER